MDGSVDMMFAPFTGEMPDWSEIMSGDKDDEDEEDNDDDEEAPAE